MRISSPLLSLWNLSHTSIKEQPASKRLSLYLIADFATSRSRATLLSRIMAATDGGVTRVQYRDYVSMPQDALRTALAIQELLKQKNIPMDINTTDTLALAKTIESDGIFIENESLSYESARKVLGEHVLIGLPLNPLDLKKHCKQSENTFLSLKLDRTQLVQERLRAIEEIRKQVSQEMVVVGGIAPEHAEAIYERLYGTDGIATRNLLEKIDPKKEAQTYSAMREKILKKSFTHKL